jgi:hypothetical protein
MQTLTREIAKKVLDTVDAGLVKGLGTQKPGGMCVEAAVCYALGLPHSDNPKCVSQAVRSLKITLNDQTWSSDKARAKGLRRLAIAQLGTDTLDDVEFTKRVTEFTIRKILPPALRLAGLTSEADRCEHEGTADAAAYAARAANAVARAAARAAYAADAAARAAYAAYAAARAAARAAAYAARAADAAADAAANAAANAAEAAYAADAARAAYAAYAVREIFAEGVVQILIAMKSPGSAWLDLTE